MTSRRRVPPPVFALLASLVASCGDSGSGGGGSSELIVEPLPDEYVLSGPVRWGRASITLTPESDGTFLLARTEVPDGSSVSVDRFDGDLTPIGEAWSVSTGANHYLTGPSLCTAGQRIGLSWSDGIPPEQLPIGVNLDLVNAHAVFVPVDASAGQTFRLNPNDIGNQGDARIACLSDGSVTAIWSSSCTGLRKISHNGYVSYEPPECTNEPVDGVYLQSFDEAGAPRTAVLLVQAIEIEGFNFGAGAIATISRDRLLVLAGSVARVYDADGAVLDEGLLPEAVSSPILSCSEASCTAVMPTWQGVVAVLLDPDDLSNVTHIPVKAPVREREEPGIVVDIVPYDGSVGCDRDGVCLVTWRLTRETWQSDYGESEDLGIFAVALDSHTGELGAETQLLDATRAFNVGNPISIAVGSGEFVTAGVTDGGVLLGRVNVR